MSEATENPTTPGTFDVPSFKPESVADWHAVWRYHDARQEIASYVADSDHPQAGAAEAAIRESMTAVFEAAEMVGRAPSGSADDLRRKLAVLRWHLEAGDAQRGNWLPLVEGMDADLSAALEMLDTTPAEAIAFLSEEAQERAAAAEAAAGSLRDVVYALPGEAPVGLAAGIEATARAVEGCQQFLTSLSEKLACTAKGGASND